MEAILAIVHITGALITLLALGYAFILFNGWRQKKIHRQEQEDIAIQLGITVFELEKDAYSKKIIALLSNRFSNDYLKNRLSDLCGLVQTCWAWLSFLVQIGVLIVVIWTTFSDSLDNAIYAWLLLMIAIFFWIVEISFSLVCKLLTGRYPGQAKRSRKLIMNYLQTTT